MIFFLVIGLYLLIKESERNGYLAFTLKELFDSVLLFLSARF